MCVQQNSFLFFLDHVGFIYPDYILVITTTSIGLFDEHSFFVFHFIF